MSFDEWDEGDYRICACAVEASVDGGFVAAVVVRRVRGIASAPREAFRDDSLACGHLWPSAAEALAYAMSRGVTLVRSGSPMLAC